MSGALAAGIGMGIAAVAVHGIYYPNSYVFGVPVSRVRGPGRIVALTFDDGPNPDATPRILDALAARDVKATFFVLGRHADRWPELVARIAREGHALGNHGWHHRKLHVRGPVYVRRDLAMGTESIARASGVRPRLFRAPHGFRSPWVTPIAASLGQKTVGWSRGVWDSDRPGVDAIVRRTVEGTRPGRIMLLHDGDGYDIEGDRRQTAEAVPRILDELAHCGYLFVTVPE
jgi:peptidoglycan/xylan/chitin deacetylase (PgdA/CDA1 family)